LTSATPTAFTGQLHFHTMETGTEGERMRLSGTNSAAVPLISLNGDLDTGFFLQSSNVIGFTTNGVERARLSVGGGSQLALKAGGSSNNCTVCTDGSGGIFCGLALMSRTQLSMSVSNGSFTAASKRMQMNNNPINAINFSVDDGTIGVVPALDVTSSIAQTTGSDTHGIKVPHTAGGTLGGIARASLNHISNWQDGHLGNCERLYFTATDFHAAGPSGFFGAQYDVAIGQPTYAYGELSWIATKLLPVGFRIASGAGNNIAILGYWHPTGAAADCTTAQIASLELYATNITHDGQPTTTLCVPAAGFAAFTTPIGIVMALPAILNSPNQITSASQTSGMGVTGGGATGGPTIMITIKVTLATIIGGAPVAGEGITGAFIDISRG